MRISYIYIFILFSPLTPSTFIKLLISCGTVVNAPEKIIVCHPNDVYIIHSIITTNAEVLLPSQYSGEILNSSSKAFTGPLYPNKHEKIPATVSDSIISGKTIIPLYRPERTKPSLRYMATHNPKNINSGMYNNNTMLLNTDCQNTSSCIIVT